MNCVHFSKKNIHREKNERALSPYRYGTKEKLHQKALLELQRRLKVGNLASKVFSRLAAKSVENAGKFEECRDPKVSLCSQQQVWSFRKKRYPEMQKKVKNPIERHQDEKTVAFFRAMASL